MGSIILANQPATPGQKALLERLSDGGCRFWGLDRVAYPSAWSVGLEGRVGLRMGSRSITHVLKAAREIRKHKIEEALIFFDSDELKGRVGPKAFFFLSGLKVNGAGPDGQAGAISKAGVMVEIIRGALALLGRLEPRRAAWFLFSVLKCRLLRRRKAMPDGCKDVLFITWGGDYGGIETALLSLLNGLDRKKYKPRLLLLGEEGRMSDDVRAAGIPVDVLGARRYTFLFVKRLADYLKQKGPDILHYHGNQLEGVQVFLAGLFYGAPAIIFHAHSTMYAGSAGIWRPGSCAFVRQRIDRVIAVSGQVREHHLQKYGYPEDMVTVVYNGVGVPARRGVGRDEARAALGIARGERTLCIAGRLSFEKGHSSLLDALARIKDVLPVKCLVCGDGPMADELKTMSDSFGLQGRVLFLGYIRDLRAVLEATDLLVMPSLTEGLPLAMLEAMSLGVPVLASAVGGIPEVIKDGENGFLLDGIDPGPLARRITQIFKDEAALEEVGRSAAETVAARFSEKRFCTEVMRIYEGLTPATGRMRAMDMPQGG